MKRFLDTLRMLFISPEFLVILVIISMNLYAKDFLTMLGFQFKINDEIWKFLPSLPLLFSGIAFKISTKVRVPFESASNKIFYEWPEYQRIVDRVKLSKFYCILCCAGAISIWIFCKQLPESLIATIFLLSTIVSGIVAFFMFESSQKLREILELHSE